MDDAARTEDNPDDLYLHFRILSFAWVGLVIVSTFVMGGLAYFGDVIDGNHGNGIGVAIGVGLAAFCGIGAADAIVRLWIVQAALRQYRRIGRQLDERSRRQMKLARLGTATLLWQLVVGVLLCASAW